MTDPAPVQLGIEMAKKAIEYDNGHMYVQAIMCYDLAVDYFGKALHLEQNEQVKDTLTSKVKEYTERSTFLKVSIGMNNLSVGGSTPGPGLQPLNQPIQPKEKEAVPSFPKSPTGYIPQPGPQPVYGGVPPTAYYGGPPPQTGGMPQMYMPVQGYAPPAQPMYFYQPPMAVPPQPLPQGQAPPLPPHPHRNTQEKGKEKEEESSSDDDDDETPSRSHVESGAGAGVAGGVLGGLASFRNSKPVGSLKAGTEKIKSSFSRGGGTSSSTHLGFMQDNFGISEDLIEKFSCSRSLLAGSMYVTENYVCWNTLIKGMDRRVVFKIEDIKTMNKTKLGGINIELMDKKEFSFSNFTARKEAYELILHQAKRMNAPVWQTMNFKLNKKLDSVEKKEDKKKAKEAKKDQKDLQKAWKKGEITSEEFMKRKHHLGDEPREKIEYSCSHQTTLSSTKGTLSAGDQGIHFEGTSAAKQLFIPYDEITEIKGARQVLKGDVLEISTLAGQYAFNNFFARDDAVKALKAVWRNHRHG